MTNYKDSASQTIWQGLTQRDDVRLVISTPHDTNTPPGETVTDKLQLDHLNSSPEPAEDNASPTTSAQTSERQPSVTEESQPQQIQPSQMESEEENHATRLIDIAHGSLPSFALNDDDPASPPPTHAILSPPPEANRRFAGHTPLFPPTQDAQDPEDYFGAAAFEQAVHDDGDARTPDADEALQGALTLPANPIDGTAEHIELDALDKVLGKIARQQAILRGDDEDVLESLPEQRNSRRGQQKQRADSEPTARATTIPSMYAGASTILERQPLPGIKRDSAVASSDASSDGHPLSQTTSEDSRKMKPKTFVQDGIVFKAGSTNFKLPWGSVPRDHRGSI
ncbi:hypothetical protein FB567DRAFT_256365 [Paraphoma chrysanthemicola]|uniref:Uncharacterized protein n=1 Tax=Paraphoma chrysanthemicola TaxID=798071 RepID=A0A8K0VRG7_9PLEO|nr:hypothetical protein FB567DRAFT_256365 [Paraphoma chrysanthemicola]